MPTKSNAIVSSHRDAATRVSTYLSEQHGLKLTPITALEVVARALGAANWQTLKAQAEQGRAPRMADVAGVGNNSQGAPASAVNGGALEQPSARPSSIVGDTSTLLDAIRKNLFFRGLARSQRLVDGVEVALDEVQQALGLSLAPVQCNALRAVMEHPICSLSGEPGTGKATVLRALIPLAEKVGLDSVYQARIRFTPTGANLAKLQSCDLLILREEVISDMPLLQFLLEQAPATCRIVFFGEMPAVAPQGQHDLIEELIGQGAIRGIRLVEKFRQTRPPIGGGDVVHITRLTPPPPLMLGEFTPGMPKYDRANPPAEDYVMHGVFNNGATAPTQSHHVDSYIYEARGFKTSHRSGKWCIVRDAASVDALWAKIREAVVSGTLPAAMVSSPAVARQFGGTYLICVFTPEWSDRYDVRRVRQLLREMGVVEELGYKRDVETVYGIQGTPDEWFYRA